MTQRLRAIAQLDARGERHLEFLLNERPTLRVEFLPVTFIINVQGKRRRTHCGFVAGQRLRHHLRNFAVIAVHVEGNAHAVSQDDDFFIFRFHEERQTYPWISWTHLVTPCPGETWTDGNVGVRAISYNSPCLIGLPELSVAEVCPHLGALKSAHGNLKS